MKFAGTRTPVDVVTINFVLLFDRTGSVRDGDRRRQGEHVLKTRQRMTRKTRFLLPLVLAAWLFGPMSAVSASGQTAPAPDWERVLAGLGLVDIQEVCPEIRVDLKYSSTDNFVHEDVYGDLDKCFLRKEAAEKLAAAQRKLTELKPGWRLLVFDGARPRRVQARFFAIVKGTPQQQYVADPAEGSIHNYGAAIDLTIVDADGRELDMGTPFDFFGDLSQPQLESEFLAQGKLAREQLDNRLLLRNVMTSAGFLPISNEWWHFDAFPPKEVRARYKIIE
jgi:D-alanyl-D-alanine dipeptidase